MPYLLIIAFALFLITFFAAMVLLDKHENTYCVPLERSASILAGLAAAFILALFYDLEMPSGAELFGASMLIVAVFLLTLAPGWSHNDAPAESDTSAKPNQDNR